MTMAATTIAVAVVLSAGRVLVGTRAADAADAAGRREFPGGKVEPGETPAAAAARECLEESGIDVLPREVILTTAAMSSRGPLELIFIAATPRPMGPGGATASPPRPPFAWVSLESLDAAEVPAANARIVELLRSGRLGAGLDGPAGTGSRPAPIDHGGS